MNKKTNELTMLKSNQKLFDLFTRKEDYNPIRSDKHQRPFFNNQSNVLKPEVSEYLLANDFHISWQDDKKFALCLTHDIDNIYPSMKSRGFNSIHFASKFKFRKAFDRLLNNENPYWNFKEIMKLEETYSAISSFYVMTDGSKYDPNHLTDELTVMIDKGYEVGLHGGYNTYNNIVEIKREKEQLEQIIGKRIIGYRNHFLRFKVPDTWLLLKNAGFEYDSTLGYSETVGFRNGMCHPFNPFDLYENKEINIVEIPPIIMDLTLLRHMKLDLQRGWDLCKRIIDTVESLNGVVTVIWHNESYNNAYRKNWEKIYSKILEYGYKKDAWMTSGKEICRWWQTYGEKKL